VYRLSSGFPTRSLCGSSDRTMTGAVAACLTGAARLMLTLLERQATALDCSWTVRAAPNPMKPRSTSPNAKWANPSPQHGSDPGMGATALLCQMPNASDRDNERPALPGRLRPLSATRTGARTKPVLRTEEAEQRLPVPPMRNQVAAADA
jgi:hypothetical protein